MPILHRRQKLPADRTSQGLAYFRLHGSPRMYWSRYDEPYIRALADTAQTLEATMEVWYVFDNTAAGAAIENAWELREWLTTAIAHRDNSDVR
jgi:uncharacterized protein YecE (DUF72 family)